MHGHDPLIENRVILVEAADAPGSWHDGSLGHIAVRIAGKHVRRLVVLRRGLDRSDLRSDVRFTHLFD